MQGHRTIRFLARAQQVITTPWYGNMCFKQWAVRKFLVAEKESGTNIHKQLKNVHDANAVDKRTVQQRA
jgi:hypothetical protein